MSPIVIGITVLVQRLLIPKSYLLGGLHCFNFK